MLSRLNKLHITMSAESKRTLIKEYGNHTEEKVIRAIAKGHDGKINGDNVDIFVRTNDMRMDNKNKDYHFFASNWTPFRITQDDFVNNPVLIEKVSAPHNTFITSDRFTPSQQETQLFRDSLKVLIGRILVKHCCAFKWAEPLLPKHIEHDLSEFMERKTESYRLPILLKNECKYDDCLDIMDSYVQNLMSWYNKAGRGYKIR